MIIFFVWNFVAITSRNPQKKIYEQDLNLKSYKSVIKINY